METESNTPVEAFDVYVASSLRMAQAEQDVTNLDLAKRANIPVRTLIRFMKGHRSIKTSALMAIAEALGTTAEAIIERARLLATSKSGLDWEQYALAAFYSDKEPEDESQ